MQPSKSGGLTISACLGLRQRIQWRVRKLHSRGNLKHDRKGEQNKIEHVRATEWGGVEYVVSGEGFSFDEREQNTYHPWQPRVGVEEQKPTVTIVPGWQCTPVKTHQWAANQRRAPASPWILASATFCAAAFQTGGTAPRERRASCQARRAPNRPAMIEKEKTTRR